MWNIPINLTPIRFNEHKDDWKNVEPQVHSALEFCKQKPISSQCVSSLCWIRNEEWMNEQINTGNEKGRKRNRQRFIHTNTSIRVHTHILKHKYTQTHTEFASVWKCHGFRTFGTVVQRIQFSGVFHTVQMRQRMKAVLNVIYQFNSLTSFARKKSSKIIRIKNCFFFSFNFWNSKHHQSSPWNCPNTKKKFPLNFLAATSGDSHYLLLSIYCCLRRETVRFTERHHIARFASMRHWMVCVWSCSDMRHFVCLTGRFFVYRSLFRLCVLMLQLLAQTNAYSSRTPSVDRKITVNSHASLQVSLSLSWWFDLTFSYFWWQKIERIELNFIN